MPRVVKQKAAAAVVAPVKKAPGGKNKSKLYAKPEPIPLNTVLADLTKTQWKIGPSIGTGGFGEIYSACKVGEKNYDYVVKCEPHGNGPLFVEMHFYMRNAKLDDIQRFKKEHGLKSLGMPYMLGNGSHDLNGQKHRFIVMPRYGSDIARFFTSNGNRLPEITIYRLALQMLDVYKFVHNCGYVHADLKGANILLGYGKTGASQAYLVDYGLASHYTTKDFKPDPKKMHNGTIEYTSRDAHQGVATMRADLEILGYNLIEWSGVKLPWVRDNLLATPAKVQQAKMDFMSDVGANLKKLYSDKVPTPIADFLKYVASMNYNDAPDYERCKKIFLTTLKSLKATNSGDLDFKSKSIASSNGEAKATVVGNKNKAKTSTKNQASKDSSTEDDSDVEEICASDDDDDDVIFEPKKSRETGNTKARPLKTALKVGSPTKRSPIARSRALKTALKASSPTKRSPISRSRTHKTALKVGSPAKRSPILKTSLATTPTVGSPTRNHSPIKNSPTPPQKRPGIHEKIQQKLNTSSSPSPTKRKHVADQSPTPPKRRHIVANTHSPSPLLKRQNAVISNSPIPSKSKQVKDANKSANPIDSSTRQKLRGTPLSTSANLNFSPSISVASSSSSSKPGKTIINDNLTPNAKAGKTYEFNFELDVSMDANVVVNVKRKKKPRDLLNANRTPTRSTPTANGTNSSLANAEDNDREDSPATRVKVRKLQADSPMQTPAVTLKKTKKFVRSPC